jgi:hypothetical protein
MEKKQRHIMLVTVDIPPEHEEAWNRWYNEEHVPDILKCPGFKRVGRFKSVQGNGTRYVTLYEVDSPTVRETKEFNAVKGWYQFAPFVIEPKVGIYNEFFSAEI